MSQSPKITSPATLTYNVVVHFSQTFAEIYLDRLEEIANKAFYELASIGNRFLVFYHCFQFEDQHLSTSSTVNDDGAIEMTLDVAGESRVVGYLPADLAEGIEKALADEKERKPN